MDQAKRALLLLAVDPGLRGILLAGGPGLAKSVLARAFRSVLPGVGATHERQPASDPEQPPFVEVPLSVTEDRLLGGLDIGRTLASGRRQANPGLLAQADGSILYVDEINLLDPSAANHIAMALETGFIRLEREGISATVPTHFLLIGTYDPEEGQGHALLTDRVGLMVAQVEPASLDMRAEIVRRVMAYERDPLAFTGQFAHEVERLRQRIVEARARLREVEIDAESLRDLSLAAIRLGIEGNRADILALRVARASAALARRLHVEPDDLKTALQLVLEPRATIITQPGEWKQESKGAGEQGGRGTENVVAMGTSSNPPAASRQPPSVPSTPAARAIDDVLIPAIDSSLPDGFLELSHRHPIERQNVRPGRSRVRSASMNDKRGRYVTSVSQPKARCEGKIAVDATLRAAALRQAEPFDRHRSGAAIKVQPADLRFKRFKQKAGRLFIFVIDASGSMAFNRMNQAKGAVTRLLQRAYLKRDKVALISFRRDQAEVLLSPTRSVELAKRALDALPVGGGTPLAAGLLAALDVAKRARRNGVGETLLVLLSDNRPNVGKSSTNGQPAIWEELGRVGAVLQSEGIASVVIDTQARFTSGGEGKRLADLLGGRYVLLPRADATAIVHTVQVAAGEQRSGGH
jgi:magnesium chelatase subunit D